MLCWRVVPADNRRIGELARQSEPLITQVQSHTQVVIARSTGRAGDRPLITQVQSHTQVVIARSTGRAGDKPLITQVQSHTHR